MILNRLKAFLRNKIFIFVREYHGTFWPVDEANEIELAEGETRGYYVTRSGTW